MDFNLGEYFPEKNSKPNDLEMIYYLFWDKGISQAEFNQLDIPYIFSMLKCFKYVKDKEQQELKRK